MHVVSPSQITAADRCLRRWWFQSVKGFKAPSTPATEFGGKVHTALERRVITGAWMPDLQAVLDRAKPAWQAFVQHTSYLPSIMGGRDVVELAWTMDDRDYPLPSQGRIDLVCGLLNTIVDWKTTSSTRYMKSEAELAVDPQVILYTDALLREG